MSAEPSELVARTAAALADPSAAAADLAAICNHRGMRDALLVLAARSGDWAGLERAAESAYLHAAGTGQHSVHGPLTVLGAARWMQDPAAEGPAAMWAAVPPEDPAHRMADLLGRIADRGHAPGAWAAALAQIDPEECAAFGPPPPAAATRTARPPAAAAAPAAVTIPAASRARTAAR